MKVKKKAKNENDLSARGKLCTFVKTKYFFLRKMGFHMWIFLADMALSMANFNRDQIP